MIGLVLSLAATMLLAVCHTGLPFWLDGRLNTSVPFTLVGLLCWLLLVIWLSWWVFVRRCEGRRQPGVRLRIALFVIPFLPLGMPWRMGFSELPADDDYARGFHRWVAANVDADAIRAWQRDLPADTDLEGTPFWLPTEREWPFSAPVPDDQRPRAIVAVAPDDVRIVADGGAVILAWRPQWGGWTRVVVIGEQGLSPPEGLSTVHFSWDTVRDGVLAGIAVRH